MKTVNTHVLFVGRLVWRDLKAKSGNLSVTKRLGRQVIVDLALGDWDLKSDGVVRHNTGSPFPGR